MTSPNPDPEADRLMAAFEEAVARQDKAAAEAALADLRRHADRDAGENIDEALLRQMAYGFGWWGDGPPPVPEGSE